MPPADLFVRQLARFQRRLRLVMSAEYAVKSIAVAIAVTDALVLTSAPGTRLTAVYLAGSVVVGLVAAVALAWRRAGLSRTAALLDRRLGLDDQVVTALQFRTDGDPVADLIVTRATESLVGNPSSVLPFESPRARWALASVAGAIVFFVAIERLPVDSEALAQLDWSAKASAERDASANTHRWSAKALAERDASNVIAPRSTAKASAERASANPDSYRWSAKASAERENANADSYRWSAKASADRESANADSYRWSAKASAERERANANRAGNGARDAGRDGRGTGRGNGAPGGSGRESGGVAWSSTTTKEPGGVDAHDSGGSYAERYRTAKAAAEAAVAQDRVPARHRALIHDYFQAIRPRADR